MGGERVFVGVDVVLFAALDGVPLVALVQRRWPPYEGLWALPGGHIEPGESTREAAQRQLRERTGLTCDQVLRLVGIYGAPGRDPRDRYFSYAYTAVLSDLPWPVPARDVRAALWVPLQAALDYPAALAFDHHRIIGAAVALMRPALGVSSGESASP